MSKTALKYKIIRIRAKLSFIAFERRMTVQELLLTKIIESYKDMVSQRLFVPKESFEEGNQKANIIMTSNIGECFSKLVQLEQQGSKSYVKL